MEKCIGCELCAGVCPADCIYVRGLDNPPDHPVSPGERYGYVYEINYLRCIHCDLCVEACPTEAITESKLFEFSFTNRSDAIYTKNELLVDDRGHAPEAPVGGLARGRRHDDLRLDARHLAVGQRGLRGRGAVVGRVGLRRPRPRGRPVGAPGRRAHRHQAPARGPRGAPLGRGHPAGAPRHAGPGVAGQDRGGEEQEEDGSDPRPPEGRGAARKAAKARGRPDAPLRPCGRFDAPHLARHTGVRRQRRRDPGRCPRGGHLAQPGACRTQPGDDALRGGRALHRAGGRLPGGRADHRLRRRHRRALPLRDHVPRRRPSRGHRRRSRSSASDRWPSSMVAITLAGVIAMLATSHWVTGAHQVVGPIEGPIAKAPDRRRRGGPARHGSCSPPTSSPSRRPPPCWSSPWSVPWCWLAAPSADSEVRRGCRRSSLDVRRGCP